MPSRHEKSRLVARLVKIVIHPLTLLSVILALIIWLVYNMLQPVIQSVPVVAQSRVITLLGHGFGERQDGNYLLITLGEQQIPIRQIHQWSNDKIVASLPAGAASGSVQVVKQLPFAPWSSALASFVVQASDLPSEPYGYRVPVQVESPWPLFRRDHQNTGRSPIQAQYYGDKLWSFRTGKGIFSTPVIDAQGTIYVGSADHVFYALNPDGTKKWSHDTGEIIDSAGALPRTGRDDVEIVLLPSGDGHLYALRADDTDSAGSIVWSFDARSAPGTGFNNWFEGNVAIGYDGTLYTGNTNFNYYALDPSGHLKWKYSTGSNNWSMAGLGDDGTIYWGSNDTYIRAVSPGGVEKWKKMTLGFIAASAAVGSDGTVYIGSFDSYFYALDPNTGNEKWKFKTGDHIYASAALGADANGNTNAIYFGSADGILYALQPDGKLLWKYDTGDPIRSSPALGRAPAGEQGNVIYFGSGNGKLYALNAQDGTRRWSFDTTPSDELRDRNDLNASPALGKTGIYIGGEHGNFWYVPYDYCLRVSNWRCQTDPGEDWPRDVLGLFYVTPGGTLSARMTEPATLPASTLITLRLIVRQGGEKIRAWVCNAPVGCPADALQVKAEPPFPFSVEHSANGEYIHILPDDILKPGQTYTLTLEGNYYTGGLPVGNLTLGGDRRGRFNDTFTFQVEEASNHPLPLAVSKDQVTALEWTRLAVPIPTMMPSLNQIGFDYMDWIMGTIALTPPDTQKQGKFILWAIGGKRDENGVLVADPNTDFTLPLNGVYQGDAFILTDQKFVMPITGIPIPFNRFQLRGQLGQDLRMRPGASAYADTGVTSIPKFGPYLVIAGLANNWIEKLLVTGTYLTRPYDASGPANRRPQGISVATVEYTPPTQAQAGQVVATLQLEPGAVYPQAAHRPGIVLVNAANTSAVYLDYRANLSSTANSYGNLATITLNIPAKTILPQYLKAVTILDVFPLDEATLTTNP